MITEVEQIETSLEVERVEVRPLGLHSKYLCKARDSPEVLDLSLLLVVEEHILTKVVNIVASKCMLTVLLRWQLVYHRGFR